MGVRKDLRSRERGLQILLLRMLGLLRWGSCSQRQCAEGVERALEEMSLIVREWLGVRVVRGNMLVCVRL